MRRGWKAADRKAEPDTSGTGEGCTGNSSNVVAALLRSAKPCTHFADAQRKRLHPKKGKPPKLFPPTVRDVEEIVPTRSFRS